MATEMKLTIQKVNVICKKGHDKIDKRVAEYIFDGGQLIFSGGRFQLFAWRWRPILYTARGV